MSSEPASAASECHNCRLLLLRLEEMARLLLDIEHLAAQQHWREPQSEAELARRLSEAGWREHEIRPPALGMGR